MKCASQLLLGPIAWVLNACVMVTPAPPASDPSAASPPAPIAASTPAPPVRPATPIAAIAPANCNYAAGTAVGGQAITVDTCSVTAGNPRAVAFIYYLGSEKIDSSADCTGGNWTTYPEQKVHYPQSTATQNMLNIVCQQAGMTAANAPAVPAAAPPVDMTNFTSIAPGNTVEVEVFDPPSNVRVTPNGAVLCAVKTVQFIPISGYVSVNQDATWYKTNVCGAEGWIHVSQIRF